MPEPYRTKMVEPVKILSHAQRAEKMKEAGYNTFLLQSEDVHIDLLTDSGTNAMSDAQWSAMMLGDEAYAGAKSFYKLEKAVQKAYGFKYVVPAHQGRGAEHMLSQSWVSKGQYIPGNMYFTTTRLHQELAGGNFVDVICEEGHNPTSDYPFKGNVSLEKLEKLVKKVGAENVAYITVGAPVNLAGGQPVSMENMKAVSKFCRAKGIKVVLDGARTVENSYMIKEREKGQGDKTIAQILLETCQCCDAMTMSAKKDCYANIGGWMATNDEALYEKAKNLCVVYEGLHTYGGMAGRDMEALAAGIEEMVRLEVIEHRIQQVRYLGNSLIELGIPVVKPIGGHAVFLDAKAFLPHLDQEKFPAQALAAHLYVETGVRGMERGIISAGRDAQGNNRRVPLELVRLALPRRVYSQTHLDFCIEGIEQLYKIRSTLTGLKFTHETPMLRFFQSRFSQA